MLEINLHVKSPLDLFLQTKGRSVGKVWGCVTKIPAGIGMFPPLIFSFAFFVVAKFLLIFLITLLYAFCCSMFLLNFSHSPPFPFWLSSIFSCEEGREGPNTSPNCQINVPYTGDAKPNAQYTTSNTNKTVFRVVIVRINVVFVASLWW